MVYTIHFIGEVILSFGSRHWFENHHQGMWSNMGYIDTQIGIVNKLQRVPIGMCGRFKSMFQCLLTHRNMWTPWEHIEIMVGFVYSFISTQRQCLYGSPKNRNWDTRSLFQVRREIHDIALLLNLVLPWTVFLNAHQQYSSMP